MTREHRRPPLLIIGGGVAGFGAALALQKAGIEAVVYEARSEIEQNRGSFLTLARNGLQVLETLDASEAVRAQGFWTERMVVYSGSGKRLGEMGNSNRGLTIERGELTEALHVEALRRGIRVEMGKKLVAAEPEGGGMTAHFADESSAHGELLLGADGIHSRVRRLIDPQAPEPQQVGLVGMGGYVHDSRLAALCESETFTFAFGKRAFYGWVVSPDGEVFWFMNIPQRESLARPERQALAGIERHAWKTRVLELVAHDRTPIAEIIQATALEKGFVGGLNDILPSVPYWHSEGMVLLGDAAHATSPSSRQGASLALEDSLILAKLLHDTSDWQEVFPAYEALRRPRVEQIQKQARNGNRTKVAGPLARGLQDLLVPLALKYFVRPQHEEWLFDYQIPWEGATSQPMLF